MPETRRAMVALYLLAMGVLLLEVSLTRVFSVMSWHHFAYLIISLALLGFGAASSFLTVSARFAGHRFDPQRMSRYALGFALATILGFAVATKVHFYPLDAYTYGDYSNIFSLALLYVIIGVPFFFAGVCIAYTISRAGEAVNRLYFADLLGAGTGALLAIGGINYLGVEATIYAAAGTGAVVALLYAPRGALRWASVAALLLSLGMTGLASRGQIFPVYFPPDKIFRLAMEPHYFRWHVVARVDVLKPGKGAWGFGGALSPTYSDSIAATPPEVQGMYQDGGAATGIMHVPAGEVQKLPVLGYYLQSVPYVMMPNAERALVIGVGGGIDVLIALYHGARQVVGVEVNPVVADAIQKRFADYAGHIFERPDVRLVCAEGRHYLTATREHYDVIQLSGVDTYSALASGAYALAENYLYTREAMREYWEHLTENGVLSFSRWLFTPPRESLRLIAIQVEAMRRMGIEHPEKHLVLIRGEEKSGNIWGETLLKHSEFTEAELEKYRQWADSMHFQILYDPFHTTDNVFDRLIRASDTARQTMIDEYPYNISPVSDDSPFFFDFYRWRSLWSPSARHGQGGYYMTKFPLALATLVISLVQILVLSAIFIIGPLVPRGAQLREVPDKKWLLLYFAALGLGFILVEIVLLQKFTVFVGGPVYAMAVTLFAILVFSGLGSLLAQRVRGSLYGSLARIMIALTVGIVLEMFFVNLAVPRLMFLSHAARCIVAVLAVAPLALLMGMPFPTGLRLAQRMSPAILPWAWGVNAVATTIGAVLCVLASMQWGFTAALLAAAVIYLLGLVALRPAATRSLRTPDRRPPLEAPTFTDVMS